MRLALELAERDPRYFMPFQYANQANPRAHYEGTGAEIAEALDRVDVLVAGLGTGGTLMGAGERLRETFPDVVVAAAEPLPGDPVMGLRSLDDGYVPPILDVAKLDRKMLVSNAESVAGLRALVDREGIFAGVSSGAVVHVARGSPRSSTRASSSASSPTAAGSTSPPTSGTRRTSTRRWSTATGGSPGRVAPCELERARRDEAPNEACGLIALRDGRRRALRAVRQRRGESRTASSWSCRTRSCRSSRTRATSSPSSTRTRPTRPRPSKTDVANIGLWEGRPYVILSRPTGELGAWTIRGGAAEPLPLPLTIQSGP